MDRTGTKTVAGPRAFRRLAPSPVLARAHRSGRLSTSTNLPDSDVVVQADDLAVKKYRPCTSPSGGLGTRNRARHGRSLLGSAVQLRLDPVTRPSNAHCGIILTWRRIPGPATHRLFNSRADGTRRRQVVPGVFVPLWDCGGALASAAARGSGQTGNIVCAYQKRR